MDNPTILIAFLAGMASFISPCCLPLYPSYLSYITGISVSQLKSNDTTKQIRFRTMLHTIFFTLGFSIVFYTLGFGAGAVGDFFKSYQDLIRQISAILIIMMGLFLTGIFQPQLLMRERKLKVKAKPTTYVGSLFIGIGFAAGWTPCIGPILGVIISMAVTDPDTWFPLITAYNLGFAIPFVVLAFFIGSTKWILKYSSAIMKVGGALMLVMGVLLFSDQMAKITNWLNTITPQWLQF